MKIVIDVNVYASSLMKPEGIPGLLLRQIFTNHKCHIIASIPILEELKQVLWYPKVRSRILLGEESLRKWLEWLELVVDIVSTKHLCHLPVIVTEDKDDDKYILAAMASNAKYIITGDQHLLKLHPYQHIEIIKPAEFYNFINE